MEPWIDKVLNLLEGKNIYLVDASKSVELISYNKGYNDKNSVNTIMGNMIPIFG